MKQINTEILTPDITGEGRIINFLHSANAGDLIYSLPGIRAACRRFDARARIMCGLDQPAIYEMGPHPLGGVMFDRNTFSMTRPLIMRQDYIYDMEIWEGEREVHYNIDQIRDSPDALGMPHTEIRQWCMMLFPEMAGSISEPWIESLVPPERPPAYIVLNITQRYRTVQVNYKFLEDIGVPVLFIGTQDEYNLIIKQCRTARWHKTKTYLEVAKVISGSRLFIGNQSSCFAVAEGMGHPRLLEICHAATNVTPATPHGTPFVDQKALEWLVNEAIK